MCVCVHVCVSIRRARPASGVRLASSGLSRCAGLPLVRSPDGEVDMSDGSSAMTTDTAGAAAADLATALQAMQVEPQCDVDGNPLRINDHVLIVLQHSSEYNGVVGQYSGRYQSTDGDLAKVTIRRPPKLRRETLELPLVPLCALRVLTHLQRQRLMIKPGRPRTLHASELAMIGLTIQRPSIGREAYGALDTWTPPELHQVRQLATGAELEGEIRKINERLDRVALSPETVRPSSCCVLAPTSTPARRPIL